MGKEEFYKAINKGRYPKYVFSQIKEGKPDKDCAALVCTESGRAVIGQFKDGKWQQAHFSSTEGGRKQEIYYSDIKEEVVYWTDGKAEDTSRDQFDD